MKKELWVIVSYQESLGMTKLLEYALTGEVTRIVLSVPRMNWGFPEAFFIAEVERLFGHKGYDVLLPIIHLHRSIKDMFSGFYGADLYLADVMPYPLTKHLYVKIKTYQEVADEDCD